MAGKTNTEAIRDVEQNVATLTERVDNLRRDIDRNMDRLEAAHTKGAEMVTRGETRLAVLEEKATMIQKALDEEDRKRWMVIVALIGCFLTLVANIALSFLHN